MTHARNVWLVIALEVVRRNTGWTRNDVIRFCLSDLVRLALDGLELQTDSTTQLAIAKGL